MIGTLLENILKMALIAWLVLVLGCELSLLLIENQLINSVPLKTHAN